MAGALEGPPTLCVVDGHGQLYRSFHAIKELSRSDGHPTNGTYGFFRSLLKTLRDIRPTHLAVAFDAKGPTFRDELFEDYKANRPPMPDSLRVQVGDVIDVISSLSVPILQVEKFESDDCMATAARWAEKRGWRCVLVTTDKDMLQLVNERVVVYNPAKRTMVQPVDVRERMGVDPEQVVDLLALCGDPTDAIPGVPGVGPKTAVKILERHGSVEELSSYIRSGGEQDAAVKKVSSHLEELQRWREMVVLRSDVDLELEEDKLALGRAEPEDVRVALGRLEMTSLTDEVVGLFCDSIPLLEGIDLGRGGD